jgi:hypothetical protein
MQVSIGGLRILLQLDAWDRAAEHLVGTVGEPDQTRVALVLRDADVG